MAAEYRFGAVIPAAGLSSRMGAFKPLLPYGGLTVIEASVGSAMPFVDTAAAVLGNRADALRAVLGRFGPRLTTAVNPDYAVTDMLASVKIGLRAMGECDAFFLLPADMPAIPAAVYEALIAAFDGTCDVIYPVCGGRRGHPPLIHARLIPDILAYEGGGGLRAILSGRSVKEVAVTDHGVLTDLDTPEDYNRIADDKGKSMNAYCCSHCGQMFEMNEAITAPFCLRCGSNQTAVMTKAETVTEQAPQTSDLRQPIQTTPAASASPDVREDASLRFKGTPAPAGRKSKKRRAIILSAVAAVLIISIITAVILNSRTEEPVVSYTYADRISAGYDHTVGVREDGTAVAAGDNKYGQCNVGDWTDIVSISAGGCHTVGLKKDGTVVSTNPNLYGNLPSYLNEGQWKVDKWKDITAISAGFTYTLGLKKDGTVVATRSVLGGDVGDWTDIIAISADFEHSVGLKKDGTVVVTGGSGDKCSTGSWTDIVAVAAGQNHTVGLKKDGTVVATGDNEYGQCNVAGWTDITAISANHLHTVGLKKDGTVVATGDNRSGQCSVGSWTNIVAISTGDYHTVGLRSDGTIVATGSNDYEKCDLRYKLMNLNADDLQLRDTFRGAL